MIYLKINRTGYNEIVAICDQNLIGKTFSEKNFKLDVTERFYKGELMKDKKIIKILKGAENINIVGRESINLCIKAGIIERENIIKIQKIPHAIIFGT